MKSHSNPWGVLDPQNFSELFVKAEATLDQLSQLYTRID
jgi:hypothetical protein